MNVLYMPEGINVSDKENIGPMKANPSELVNTVSSNVLSRIRYQRAKRERQLRIFQKYLRMSDDNTTDEEILPEDDENANAK